MIKYKLNRARDVDVDGPDNLLLNLVPGWRFNDEVVHVRSFDSMQAIRLAVKYEVIPCDCADCSKAISK